VSHIPAVVIALGARRAAVPVDRVVEVMRPLPLAATDVSGTWCRGSAVVRGRRTRVVPLADVVAGASTRVSRWLRVTPDGEPAVLECTQVLGVQSWRGADLVALPGLLDGVASTVRAEARSTGLFDVLDVARWLDDGAA
jgi:chemotaxis signal transduction protein